MQLALRFHTSVLSIALVFRNPEMSPDESVFQFQQIQKKEMIYFVLGLGINKKTEKKMIFIFFWNCESPSTTHCCKKKKWRLFFSNDYPNFRDIMQQIGEKKVASDINEWQMPSVTISDRGELHTDRTKEGMKFATSWAKQIVFTKKVKLCLVGNLPIRASDNPSFCCRRPYPCYPVSMIFHLI